MSARWLRRVGSALGLAGCAWFLHLLLAQDGLAALGALPVVLWLVLPLGALAHLLHTRSFALAFTRAPEQHRVSFGALFAVRLAGEAINNGLASAYVAGEPVKAVLCARRGVDAAAAFAATIVGKTTFLFGQVCFLVVGLGAALMWFGGESPVVSMLVVVCAGGLVAIALAIVLQKRRVVGRAARFLSAARLGPKRLWERALPGADAIDAAVRGYHEHQRGDFRRSTAWATAGWLVGTLELYLFLRIAAPVEQPLLFALAVEAAIAVVKGLAFAVPGGIGVQESGIVGLFEAGGLGNEAGVAYALLRRTRELAWVGLGFAMLARELRRSSDGAVGQAAGQTLQSPVVVAARERRPNPR